MSPLTEGPAEQKRHYRRNLLIVSGGLALLGFAWWGFKVWIHRPQVLKSHCYAGALICPLSYEQQRRYAESRRIEMPSS